MNEQGKEDFEQNLWKKSGTWLRFYKFNLIQ